MLDSNVVKFPIGVSRRARARLSRESKKSPEERAAKLLPSAKSERCGQSNPLRAKIVAVSRAATIAGRVNYQSRDLSRIGPLGERHSQELRSAAKEARYLASEFERAAGELAPCQRGGEDHQSATADDAKARMDHHEAELRKAWQDYYGPAHNVRGGGERVPVGTVSPASVRDDGREFGPHYTISSFFIFAGGGES